MALQMFTDDEEYVIAESVEDVKAVLRELHCEPDEEVEWSAVPLDSPFKFNHQDARGVEEKTVAEWIAQEGRGYFAGPI